MPAAKILTVGTVDFHGSVDITDPCYNRTVWCRMNDVKIAEGAYICEVHVSKHWIAMPTDNPNITRRAYYDRIDEIAIYRADDFITNHRDTVREQMVCIGEIGVDAGLAGFFHNKPDYNDEEWALFCNQLNRKDFYINEDGFFATSGDGDGSYNVYAYNDPTTGEVTALKIDFTCYADMDDEN